MRLRYAIVATFSIAFVMLSATAQSKVYRCETNGKVAYSDAPCVGAKEIDATPTQGMDRMSGKSSKGREVQRDEFNRQFDKALQPLHSRGRDEMDVLRRRVSLPASHQQQCSRLDSLLPVLEGEAAHAAGGAKAAADVNLYKARKRFFDLNC